MVQLLKLTSEVRAKVKASRITILSFKAAFQEYLNQYNANASNYNGFAGYVGIEGNWVSGYDEYHSIAFSIGFCYKIDYDHGYIIIDHVDIEEN